MHVAWGGWPRAWPAGNLVNVYTRRSEVEVERPLGMVLASRPNGKGVVVEELVDGAFAAVLLQQVALASSLTHSFLPCACLDTRG